MLKAAVIGVGEMGKNHVRIYSKLENVELVSVADVKQENLERIKKEYKVKTYDDIINMLDSEKLDIVSIAVPTEKHREVALEAISRGISILIEKPIALNEEEAQEIIDTAKDKGVKLMIGHVERFNPAVIELKKRLSELGQIYKIDVERIGPFPNRIADVGVIIDLSVHDLDIIGYLLDSEPISISAKTQQLLHQKAEDSVVAMLKYPDEILATLNINYLSPTKIRQLSVFGKRGMFRVDYLHQDLYFCENPSYDEEAEKKGSLWGVSEGHMKKIDVDKKEPLLVEIEAFVSCVQDDEKPAVSGSDGLKALKLANMLKRSSEDKRILEL